MEGTLRENGHVKTVFQKSQVKTYFKKEVSTGCHSQKSLVFDRRGPSDYGR